MDTIDAVFNIGIPVGLILLGLIAGRAAEAAHVRSLTRRENECAETALTDIRAFSEPLDPSRGGALVVGEVVIATDYLKSIFLVLRRIFGGEVRSYETLLTRARREAIQRMVEEAKRLGHNAVCNVRLETSMIGGAASRGVATVGVIASGTAHTVRR